MKKALISGLGISSGQLRLLSLVAFTSVNDCEVEEKEEIEIGIQKRDVSNMKANIMASLSKIDFRTSLRAKLLGYILLICTVPYVFGAVYITNIVENQVKANYAANSLAKMVEVQNYIEDVIFQQAKNTIAMISSDERMLSLDNSINNYTNYDANFIYRDSAKEKEITNYLERVKASNKDIGLVGLGTQYGGYVNVPKFMTAKAYDPRERPWYKAAVSNKGQIVISDPYITESTKEMTIGISKSIERNGETIGVVSLGIGLQDFQKKLNESKFGRTGYLIVLNQNNKILTYPGHEELLLKTPENAEIPFLNDLNEKADKVTIQQIGGVSCAVAVNISPITGWKVISVIDEKEYNEQSNVIRNSASATFLVILLLILVIVPVIANKITSPIRTLVVATKRLAEGNISHMALGINSKDEIGQLAKAFEGMATSLRSIIHQVQNNAHQVAALSEQLAASADESTTASEEVVSTFTEVEDATEKQVLAIIETSNTVDAMSKELQEIASSANDVARTSLSATDVANDGTKAITTAIEQMNKIDTVVNYSAEVIANLKERSAEIGNIVATITNIAGQTNLLALNAAIEAARAGERGRGFAVVADEVRKLAEQSGESATRITRLIGIIQEETKNAVQATNNGASEVKIGTDVISKAGIAFKDIFRFVSLTSEEASKVTETVQSAMNWNQDVISHMGQIRSSSTGIVAQTKNVSAVSEEQVAIMEEFVSSSQALAKIAEELQNAVATFKL